MSLTTNQKKHKRPEWLKLDRKMYTLLEITTFRKL